jgi:hypothetical protein
MGCACSEIPRRPHDIKTHQNKKVSGNPSGFPPRSWEFNNLEKSDGVKKAKETQAKTRENPA